MASINGISSPLTYPGQIGRPSLAPSLEKSSETSFGDQISSAINNVNDLQLKADELMGQAASGNPEDAHKGVIAMEHALMALDFTLQVRNKVLDAYQEIMKTQL